ncbi:MAG: pyruvate formate lyase family protein, partial [Gemmatimonadota bacterium]
MTDTAVARGRAIDAPFTCQDRIDAVRATKMAQTREKQEVIGAMDYDDWALVLPPEDRREVTEAVSGSGLTIRDCLIAGVEIESNHPSGGFFGPEICGRNFRRLLEAHPPYVDPMSSLAGAYMANFSSYRKVGWNPDVKPPADLQQRREKYKLAGGIGGAQHFCQDMAIGLELGLGGLADKVAHYRKANPHRAEFYDGLGHVIAGMQAWIRNTATEARRLAAEEEHPQLRQNLEEMAEINERLVTEPPATFREACQWILWYDCAARMYNGSGSLGRLDEMLRPFYERETAAGTLTDEEAILHIACLLVRDTAYIQLGGPDESGRDVTSPVSYLVLEAAHRLKVPANVGVCVGDSVDPGLLRRSVEILLEDRLGIPKFLGIDRTTEGFARNGIPLEVARLRAYSGCHWSALPGREYTLNDCVKISFGNVFDVALREMLADASAKPSVAELWRRFDLHLHAAVDAMAESLDFHLKHMGDIFPELPLDLLCYGPVEKGYDAADGFHRGVEYYNMCIDGCALATVADSFAAVELHVEEKGELTWADLLRHLDANW